MVSRVAPCPRRQLSGRNMGYTFMNFRAVDASKPSEDFDSMVSCV